MNYPTKGDGMRYDVITFALPKGRLLKDAVNFLLKAGIDASEVLSETRKLVL